MWLAFLAHIVYMIVAHAGLKAIPGTFSKMHDAAMRLVEQRVDQYAWGDRWR